MKMKMPTMNWQPHVLTCELVLNERLEVETSDNQLSDDEEKQDGDRREDRGWPAIHLQTKQYSARS